MSDKQELDAIVNIDLVDVELRCAAASIEGTNEAWESRALERELAAAKNNYELATSASRNLCDEILAVRKELAETKESNLELVKDLAWQKQYAMRWEKAANVLIKELTEAKAQLVELDHCRMEAERAEALAKEVEALKVDATRIQAHCSLRFLELEKENAALEQKVADELTRVYAERDRVLIEIQDVIREKEALKKLTKEVLEKFVSGVSDKGVNELREMLK